MKLKEIPKIGETYRCFDDGKIRRSTLYEVKITEIIPFRDADEKTLKLWKEEGLSIYWLFEKTDYFIKSISTECEEEPECTFARTKDGGWFGLGYFWNSGRLDINGDLFKTLPPE